MVRTLAIVVLLAPFASAQVPKKKTAAPAKTSAPAKKVTPATPTAPEPPTVFPVEAILVEGNKRYNADQVIAAPDMRKLVNDHAVDA